MLFHLNCCNTFSLNKLSCDHQKNIKNWHILLCHQKDKNHFCNFSWNNSLFNWGITQNVTQGIWSFSPERKENHFKSSKWQTQMKRRSCFQNKSFPKTSTSKNVFLKTTIKAEILNTYFDRSVKKTPLEKLISPQHGRC